ncbi:hypothetical protein INT44_002981 [Umbelopsis vinacea]|uniref:Uncharacterized protein n=1 Tax=Umbelopsis vinacea TaxID=44442 RepID=A0A8H7UKQ6_9FUNG|nr:hypothetical protein INT44_002981 [Umbelopsis vinacea]
MSNSDAVYLTNAQDTPTSQTEPRDYILIIIGLISSAACLAMILSDLRRMCCGCLKKKKEEQEPKRPSIIVELSVGSIVLVWWVAMITYTLTSYDGFPRCAMTGPKDVTGKVYSGCHLMDGALGAGILSSIIWILTNVVASLRGQLNPSQESKESGHNAVESNLSV